MTFKESFQEHQSDWIDRRFSGDHKLDSKELDTAIVEHDFRAIYQHPRDDRFLRIFVLHLTKDPPLFNLRSRLLIDLDGFNILRRLRFSIHQSRRCQSLTCLQGDIQALTNEAFLFHLHIDWRDCGRRYTESIFEVSQYPEHCFGSKNVDLISLRIACVVWLLRMISRIHIVSVY